MIRIRVSIFASFFYFITNAQAGLMRDSLEELLRKCGAVKLADKVASLGVFSTKTDELAKYKNWNAGVGVNGGNHLSGQRDYVFPGKKKTYLSSLHLNVREGTMVANLPVNPELGDVSDRVRRLGLAGIEAIRAGKSNEIPFNKVKIDGLNNVSASARGDDAAFHALDLVHKNSSVDNDSLLRITRLNKKERQKLRKWFDESYQQKDPSGAYQPELNFNRVFPPDYAINGPILSDQQVAIADKLIDQGIIEKPHFFYDEEGQRLSPENFVNRLIHARWQKIGTEVDAIRGGQQLQNAQAAWEAAGKPELSLDVITKIIDPELRKRVDVRPKVVQKNEIPKIEHVKKPVSVSEALYNEWVRLREEANVMFHNLISVLADESKKAEYEESYTKYKAHNKLINDIENQHVDLRRDRRIAEKMSEDHIDDKLQTLLSETFRFNVNSTTFEGRQIRSGYENKTLFQLASDPEFKEALKKEFKRLYYDVAMPNDNFQIDTELQNFMTEWYYPR